MSVPAVRAQIHLNNQAGIHALGFGTWQAEPGKVKQAVMDAVRNGFRHIDCAAIYDNESEVGAALAQLFAESVVKREELFITTKLWNTHHKPEHVRPALEASLRRLRLSYVDLYLVHWPVAWAHKGKDFDDFSEAFPENETGGSDCIDVPLPETWKAMEALYDAKLAHAIGISNYSAEQIQQLIKNCRVLPAAHQVECHPGLPQTELKHLHAKYGIVTESYCPLGIGMGSIEHSLLKHPRIAELAEAEKTNPADLLLRWNLQSGNVVLSKSVTSERIAQNAATSMEPLSAATMDGLRKFGEEHPLRVCNPGSFLSEPRLFFDTTAPSSYAP